MLTAVFAVEAGKGKGQVLFIKFSGIRLSFLDHGVIVHHFFNKVNSWFENYFRFFVEIENFFHLHNKTFPFYYNLTKLPAPS